MDQSVDSAGFGVKCRPEGGEGKGGGEEGKGGERRRMEGSGAPAAAEASASWRIGMSYCHSQHGAGSAGMCGSGGCLHWLLNRVLPSNLLFLLQGIYVKIYACLLKFRSH